MTSREITKQFYYGPHLCRAIECLRAGYPENACCWIERDLGEENADLSYGSIDPKSLEMGRDRILFLTHAEQATNVEGDGI